MAYVSIGEVRCSLCGCDESTGEVLVGKGPAAVCAHCIEALSAKLGESRGDGAPANGTDVQRHGRQPTLRALLEAHFAPFSLDDLITVRRVFPLRARVDVQRGLDAALGDGTPPFGYSVRYHYETIGFVDLIAAGQGRDAPSLAPTPYEDIDVGGDETVRCLQNGLWLRRADDLPFAVVLSRHREYGPSQAVQVEIAAPRLPRSEETANSILRTLELAVAQAGTYRGKVLSLENGDPYSGRAVAIKVHRLPIADRNDLVLPSATIALIERNVLNFVRDRPRLAALGMPVRKGLLLYGPPGTGKTFTIQYLTRRLPGHTTFIVTAEQVGLLQEYFELARVMQPAMMVIEDADLIARERESMNNPCTESLLNRLLNEMDGLREDAEILFVLTTNRPEAIEPALSNRPGRIDQSIEFPLPDEEGRKKLIRVYARRLELDESFVTATARRIEGATGAFIKELMRRATQVQLERGDPCVADEHIDVAIDEMLHEGGPLGQRLLGAGTVAPVGRGSLER
jgi:hypothetical protein